MKRLDVIAGLGFAAGWLAFAYWLWPEDPVTRPSRAIGSIVSVLIGLAGVIWAVAERRGE